MSTPAVFYCGMTMMATEEKVSKEPCASLSQLVCAIVEMLTNVVVAAVVVVMKDIHDNNEVD